MKENSMNILLSFNSNYYQLARILIISLMEFHNDLHFYICYSDLTNREQKKIKQLVKSNKATFIKVHNNIFDNFERPHYVSKETWYRLFLWEKIDVDKIMYMDVDMVINGNIRGLYDSDLKNDKYLITACQDIGKVDFKSVYEGMGLENAPYFNAGIIVFNISRMKKNKITAKSIIEYAFKEKTNLKIADQDALNGYFYGKVNFQNPYVYNFLVKSDIVKKDTKDEIKVYHYATPRKPNELKYTGDYHDIFKKYAYLDKEYASRYHCIFAINKMARIVKKIIKRKKIKL